jgi:hypothetical protein
VGNQALNFCARWGDNLLALIGYESDNHRWYDNAPASPWLKRHRIRRSKHGDFHYSHFPEVA